MAISKVAFTTDYLMAKIVNGEFATTIPPQDVLSKELKISRTVLREAISKLESWNVLTIRPKTGTRINPVTAWSVINTPIAAYRLVGQDHSGSIALIDQMLADLRVKLVTIAEGVQQEAVAA